jgi:hypothetical protein
MPSSTIEKFEGGTNTMSFSCSSNISPIASLYLLLCVSQQESEKPRALIFSDDMNAGGSRRGSIYKKEKSRSCF